MPALHLRPATCDDLEALQRWDTDPHVIASTTDSTDATKAFGDHDWSVELGQQTPVSYFLIGELDGRPIGAMQVCDPREEPTHYWGDCEPDVRALDIWIGEAADRGKGHGEAMIRMAFQRCFAEPAVTAILIDPLASNTRAHAFYRRLGFSIEGRRWFGEDDCLVMRLTRAAWRQRFPGDG